MRVERELVNALQELGFAAERMPLSGAAGGRFSGDISVPVLGVDWRIEVKCRSHGFATIYDMLGDNHALIIKADRLPPLLVTPLSRAAEVALVAESKKTYPNRVCTILDTLEQNQHLTLGETKC